jgi:phenylacetate-CoA ligase
MRLDSSPLGLNLRRIDGFKGRSDNMVKLRGINIFPTGIGSILTESNVELGSEYICELSRKKGQDELTVWVETRGNVLALVDAYEALLRRRLGVEIKVKLAALGKLSELTQIKSRQKPIRLIDKRENDK